MTITIRPLRAVEVSVLVDWASAEGWNPGTADASAFYSADPEGFIGAFADGQMVAGIAAVRYVLPSERSRGFGFIGLYIVRPDQRGRGYGRAVWDAGLAHLEGCTIGLDGVVAQQDNYAGMGFERAYDTIRFSGRARVRPPNDPFVNFRTPKPKDLRGLVAYDRRFFPAMRERFLDAWLREPRLWHVATVNGRLVGCAALRPCHSGAKIGPLLADTHAIALGLFDSLAAEWRGEIHIDAPLPNQAFVAGLEARGLTRGFETARMYRGPAPTIALPYGVTTLELG